ncbi:unnamed protein product [Pleuronectes platessa]|uniref:Uncharacterized protein n=1 Tax=Pleuronectes platessa TaxID=8262 RepID=A0A9N7YML7_PLEPL|nr:unnamed protein product [Pleuronectes platessa]
MRGTAQHHQSADDTTVMGLITGHEDQPPSPLVRQLHRLNREVSQRVGVPSTSPGRSTIHRDLYTQRAGRRAADQKPITNHELFSCCVWRRYAATGSETVSSRELDF